MEYLIRELDERAYAISQSKKICKDDVEKFCEAALNYVNDHHTPISDLKQTMAFFKSNYNDLKKFCLDKILEQGYFPGKIEFLFGLSYHDEAIKDQIFSKFEQATKDFFKFVLGRASKKDTCCSGDDFKKAAIRLPYDTHVYLTNQILNVDPRIFAEEFPSNFPQLSAFVFNTLDYLYNVKSPLLKDYCLQIFKEPDERIPKDSGLLQSSFLFLKVFHTLGLHYLMASKTDLGEDRYLVKQKICDHDADFKFLDNIVKQYESRTSNNYTNLLSYLAKSQLLKYPVIKDLVKKELSKENLNDVWPFFISVLESYPGLIKDPSSLKQKVECLKTDEYAGLLNYDPRFSNCEQPTYDLVFDLLKELHEINDESKHRRHEGLIRHLEHLVYLLCPFRGFDEDSRKKIKSSLSYLKNEPLIGINEFTDLLVDVSSWQSELERMVYSSFVNSSVSLLKLNDRVNHNDLRVNLVLCLDDLVASLRELKEDSKAPSDEMKGYLDSILSSMKKRGVCSWQQNLKARPGSTRLSQSERSDLLSDIKGWIDDFRIFARHELVCEDVNDDKRKNYLFNELSDKAHYLSKTSSISEDDLSELGKFVYELVDLNERPMFVYDEIMNALAGKNTVLKDLVLNNLGSKEYFTGKIELAFGLKFFDNKIEETIFSEFKKAVDSFYDFFSLKKLPDHVNKEDYEAIISNLPLGKEDLTTKIGDVDDALIFLPPNALNLSDFIFGTLDYLNKVNSPLLKDYCLYCLEKRDFGKWYDEIKESPSPFFSLKYLIALNYLNKGSVDVSNKRFNLKNNIEKLDSVFNFLETITLNYFNDSSLNTSLLSYLIQNRLLSPSSLFSFMQKDLSKGFGSYGAELVYRNILVNYPGLIKDTSRFKDMVNSFLNPNETLSLFIDYKPDFCKEFNREDPTNESIITLYQEFYSLEKHLNQFDPVMDVLDHLRDILYVSGSFKKTHKNLHDSVMSFYDGVLHKGGLRFDYELYSELKEELSDWIINNKDGTGFADTTISLLKLEDLINDNSSRADVVREFEQLENLLLSLEIKDVKKWHNLTKSKELLLSPDEKSKLLIDVNTWFKDITDKAKMHFITV